MNNANVANKTIAKKPRILAVDDDHGVILTLEMMLSNDSDFFSTSDPLKAIGIIGSEQIDVVLLDIHMPQIEGREVLQEIKSHFPDVEVIMFTIHADVKAVVDHIKLGAFSYVVKGDMEEADLKDTINRAHEKVRLKKEDQKRSMTKLIGDKDIFIGHDKKIVTVYDQAKKIAPATNINVLIRGETGVGKEYLARYIHEVSDRKKKEFVAVNCGAIPDTLIESELFGHERGAFTDASQTKIGKFERAHGGTIFLDEIGTMTPEMQVRLLRVLQERVIERVGGNKEIKVDVRIIAATNTNIEQDIKDGRFREDLYYRLNGIELYLPALRDRLDDFEELLSFLIHKHCKDQGISIKHVSPPLFSLLKTASWKGNIRELDSLIQVIVYLLKDDDEISLANFPREWAFRLFVKYKDIKKEDPETKKKIIQKILQAFKGNYTAAAEFLEVDRATIYRILEK